MANSPDVENKRVQATVPLDVCRKVEKTFSRPGDTKPALCYVRALEEATRNVRLDSHDYEIIAEQVRLNEVKYGKKRKAARK